MFIVADLASLTLLFVNNSDDNELCTERLVDSLLIVAPIVCGGSVLCSTKCPF